MADESMLELLRQQWPEVDGELDVLHSRLCRRLDPQQQRKRRRRLMQGLCIGLGALIGTAGGVLAMGYILICLAAHLLSLSIPPPS